MNQTNDTTGEYRIPSLSELLEVANGQMLEAFIAFHVWKWLEIAMNIQTSAHEKNIEIMERYSPVFHQLRLSSYKSFVIDLWTFFDKTYTENFSLSKLTTALQEERASEKFTNLSAQIEEIKTKHGITISFLQELRRSIAHRKTKEERKNFKWSDLEDLFNGVQEIVNLISDQTEGTVSSWKHIQPEVERSMGWIFENLERGESARLENIRKEYPDLDI